MSLKQTTAAALGLADTAWHAELVAIFGPTKAREARYTAKGAGYPGTMLRKLYDHRKACMTAWEATIERREVKADANQA